MVILNLYKRLETGHWYISQGNQNVEKYTRFLNNSILITLLADKFGLNITVWGIVYLNVCAFVIFLSIGKVLTVLKLIEFNNSLNNAQNPPILKILEVHNDTQEIKRLLENKKAT